MCACIKRSPTNGAPGAALANAEALVSVSESRDDKRWTFAELADDASRVRPCSVSSRTRSSLSSESRCLYASRVFCSSSTQRSSSPWPRLWRRPFSCR